MDPLSLSIARISFSNPITLMSFSTTSFHGLAVHPLPSLLRPLLRLYPLLYPHLISTLSQTTSNQVSLTTFLSTSTLSSTSEVSIRTVFETMRTSLRIRKYFKAKQCERIVTTDRTYTVFFQRQSIVNWGLSLW